MRFIRLTFIFVILLTLTSCIEIIEELWINSDKSGKVEMRLEAGGGFGILLSTIGDYVDSDVVNDITTTPNRFSQRLQKLDGISEIKPISNLKEGKVSFSFNFDGPKSLNKAYYSMFGVEKKLFYPKFYKINKHRLKKRNLFTYINKYLVENQAKFKSEEIFKMINLVSVYHLPADVKKIKNQTNSQLTEPKTVIQTIKAEKLMKETVDLSQRIVF